MSVAEVFDYLTDTRVGNGIVVLIGALIFYGLFRLTIKIIDYIIFKKLMAKIMQAVFADEDEDSEHFRNVPASHHEDEQSQKKDKKLEQKREAERMQNMENDIRGGQRQRPKKQIVGMVQPIGKWTARVAKQMLQKYQNIDMNLVNEKGYFQALVLAERQKLGMSNGQQAGGGRGM